MSIEAQGASDGVISIRNGVPPALSDPPGGVPRVPDRDPRPHAEPTEVEPQDGPDLPDNEPPPIPPRREAAEVEISFQRTVHVSRSHRHK